MKNALIAMIMCGLALVNGEPVINAKTSNSIDAWVKKSWLETGSAEELFGQGTFTKTLLG